MGAVEQVDADALFDYAYQQAPKGYSWNKYPPSSLASKIDAQGRWQISTAGAGAEPSASRVRPLPHSGASHCWPARPSRRGHPVRHRGNFVGTASKDAAIPEKCVYRVRHERRWRPGIMRRARENPYLGT